MNFKLASASKEQRVQFLQNNSQATAQATPPPPQEKPHINVVFCIPGRDFTGAFLQCWTNLINTLHANRISFALSNTYSPVVYYARTACLRGHVLRGIEQLPFDGEITYDYIMWIDSDIVFTPENFYNLLKRLIDNPSMQMISGIYMMQDGHHTTCVDKWDEEHFSKNGSFKFLTLQDIEEKKKEPEFHQLNGVFPCVYIGFGWLLVRSGVHETFKYPFFKPQFHTLDNGRIYDFSSEDASFFLELREKGIKCYVDPSVRVGHEKRVVL
jgi:hypothetical protein